MNKYMKYAAALAMTCTLAGCNLDADFTEYVTQDRHNELVDDLQTQPKVAKAAIAKIYSIYQDFYKSHDDFGLKAFHIATDMMCEDIAYKNLGWFQYDYLLDNREESYRRTNSTWKQFYSIIAKVNLHLETYFATESTDPTFLASKGEALALRGISYFHLVNFYQHTYKGHEDAPGVPVTLKSTDGNLPRASVKDVYAQIISDLTFAVEHCAATTTHTDVDKSVAAAYLAKAYAQMEDWANVEKYAAIAAEGGSDVASEPGRGWDMGQGDILWAYDINAQNSTLWASFWSHMDQFLPRGYAPGGQKKLIHNALYNKIPATDSRRKLWVNLTDYPQVAEQIKAKSQNGEVVMENYDQLKFIAGDVAMEQDYCFLRVQDPILLQIEAMVEQGKLSEATAKLTSFAQLRNPDFVAPTTQNELREEVRFQRRIELWGEGTNWFDMKRWKLHINRQVPDTNHPASARFNIATDDAKFYHKIPVSEINANKELVQND